MDRYIKGNEDVVYLGVSINNMFSLDTNLTTFDLEGKVWIAGGCFLSKITNTPIADIDFFFLNKKTREAFMSILKKICSFTVDFETDAAIHGHGLLLNDLGLLQSIEIDLIKLDYESKEHVLDAFDFTIIKFISNFLFSDSFHHKNDTLCSTSSFADIAFKRLVLDRDISTYTIDDNLNLKRLQKYIAKGYTAANETLMKLGEYYNSMPLEDLNKSLYSDKIELKRGEIQLKKSKIPLKKGNVSGDFLDELF